MNKNLWIHRFYILISILLIIDIGITYYALTNIRGIEEVNPLVLFLIQRIGLIASLLGLGLGLILLMGIWAFLSIKINNNAVKNFALFIFITGIILRIFVILINIYSILTVT